MRKRIQHWLLLPALILSSGEGWSQTASFLTSKDQDCNILKVNLDASASTGQAPLTYFWDFGNGNTISGPDKAIVDAIYIEPGTPTVSLYVQDANGKRSPVATKQLTILEGPKIDFSPNKTAICAGQTVTFRNTTLPGSSAITGYIWNIGNAVPVRQQSPTVTFDEQGLFDVTLVVTDANGCNVSLKKEKLILVKNKFSAAFSADSIYSCKSPFTTQFRDRTNYQEVAGHTFEYLWTFRDGTSSTAQNPLKTFSSFGTYGLTFRVSDLTDGCVSETEIPAYIRVGVAQPKLAIAFKEKRCSEYTYTINPNDEEAPPLFRKTVALGDGTIHVLSTDFFTHTYKKAGTYVLKTTYSDPNNPSCVQVGFDTLTIAPSSEKITADILYACNVPMTVQFGATGITDALFYEWDFGDGTTSDAPQPTKTYNTKGVYDITLKVWSDKGCIYTLSEEDFIKVGKTDVSFTSNARRISEYPPGFNIQPLADTSALWGGCAPFSVQFNNTSVPQAGTVYTWDYGDGTVETNASLSPSHLYTKEGVFSPTLTATDASGCSGTYTCEACVRVGKPPVATIVASGPDTVCCLYDKTFAAQVDTSLVDMLWYDINLNDNYNPALTMAYYKDSLGKWVLEDRTITTVEYIPRGLGLRYTQTNFSFSQGNDPDFFFSAYKNGCATKIALPKYQHHILPWGTFKPLPCEQEENLKAGDTLDFNKIGADWLIGVEKDGSYRKLAKAEVIFEYRGVNGCSAPTVRQIYTPASLGFELIEGAAQKIMQAGLFPKIAVPACASKGDEWVTTTNLYTHEDAMRFYNGGKCLCEEHWPYKIGSPRVPDYTLSAREGCAPLLVSFESTDTDPTFQWIMQDGTVLRGNKASYLFDKPGLYKFKIQTGVCSPAGWLDSIRVFASPVAHFGANQTTFCLSEDSMNTTNRTIVLTDSSRSATNTLVLWQWDLGNGTKIIQPNDSTIRYRYKASDTPADPTQSQLVRLTVTDNRGCTAKDSLAIRLRTVTPAFSLQRAAGCYDTLRVLPLFPKMGSFPVYEGNVSVFAASHPTVALATHPLSSLSNTPILLNSNGLYTVRMTIEKDALGSCVRSKDSLIQVDYPALEADFRPIGQTQFGCSPALVHAQDSSRAVGGNKIVSWEWTLTNLSTKIQLKATGPIPPPFALTDTGYYSGTLSVTDQVGCRKTVRKDSVFYISELRGSIDSISMPLCPGELAYFRGSSPNASQFFWDFGDGSIGVGASVQHAYSSSGERNISFILGDSGTCRKSYGGKITMKPAPTFELGNDTLICEGQPLRLAGPLNPLYAYTWNNQSHLATLDVTQPGIYRLTVRDTTLNCPFTDSIRVGVSVPPQVFISPIAPLCKGETAVLKASIGPGATAITWKNKGNAIGNTDSIRFLVQDTATVWLHVTNKDQCTSQTSYTLPVLARPQLVLRDTAICPEDSVLLVARVTYPHTLFHFQWKQNNQLLPDTLPQLLVKQPALYTLTYGKPNCLASASATLGWHPLPDPTTNEERVIFCEEQGTTRLDAGNATTFLWIASGSTDRYLTVDTLGTYLVRIGNAFHCYAMDSVVVENRCPPKLYVPNAFTPEQIGENQFHTLFAYNVGAFHLLVFNRWGEIIYESLDPKKPWDGKYRGEWMPSGVYPWIITYTGNNPDYVKVQKLEGKVVLVR